MPPKSPSSSRGLLGLLGEIRDLGRSGDREPREFKAAARRNWSAVPCGTDVTLAARHTREYFEEIERYRYRTQPWTAQAIDRLEVQGRRVLEVGFGAGTDHLRLARRGARLAGVDLTPENFVETSRRFAHDGRRPAIAVADAESLPFRDGVFDVAFCTDLLRFLDVRAAQAALREAARVLRPGCLLLVWDLAPPEGKFAWWQRFWLRAYNREGVRIASQKNLMSLAERSGFSFTRPGDLRPWLWPPVPRASFVAAVLPPGWRREGNNLIPPDDAP